MKVARLLLLGSLLGALAVPGLGKAGPSVTAVPLSSPAPSWYTPELHAQVLAAGPQGVALPDSMTIPTAGIAFLGIRPGQLIIVGGGTLCSTNFVFRDGGNYAIGTAGHCGKAGAQVTMLALPRVLFNIGKIVKSVDGGPGNDFALISINPALNGLVSPSMAVWGGPTGAFSGPKRPTVVKHVGWGAGIGTGGTPRVGAGYQWTSSLWRFGGLIAQGDSGSGATAGDNKAVGNITHIVFNSNKWPPLYNAGTSIARILQIAGLPLATCSGVPWPLYGCPGS